MNPPTIEIRTPQRPAEFDAVREIFREYAASLNIDLCFQGFEQELANLPGDYAAPRGALLLALVDGQVAGCCALRPLDNADYPNACEMKRLYVRPAARGRGAGRALCQRLLADATAAGYRMMKLDTEADFAAATGLYRSLGFAEIPRYNDDPEASTVWMGKVLPMQPGA